MAWLSPTRWRHRSRCRAHRRLGAPASAPVRQHPLEVFVAVCKRMGVETGIDLYKIMDVAETWWCR
ncbi:hypothetical protein [Pseudomonas frederiksbergensis]|uniref:hypothetical protein n=1 Tax=Pseudomonas frederiksbergensis TaxID=104087 RepID=UPI001F357622|nr:hypothetical protein [Pseudomonas frederiksbergensis]